MGKLIVFLLVCGAVCWFVKSMSGKKKSGNSSWQSSPPVATPHSAPRAKQNASQLEKADNGQATIWFSSMVAELEKGTLAYCIFWQAWELKLPVEKIEELQRQYGKMSLQPSIVEFVYDFREHGLSAQALNRLGVVWLQKNGVSATEANWKKAIDAWCLEQQQKKAEKILAAVKK